MLSNSNSLDKEEYNEQVNELIDSSNNLKF